MWDIPERISLIPEPSEQMSESHASGGNGSALSLFYRFISWKGRNMVFSAIVLAAVVTASQGMEAKTISYQQDNTALEGKLVSPKSAKGKAPGVLLMPDW